MRVREYKPGFGKGGVSNDFDADAARNKETGGARQAVAKLLADHREELGKALGDDIMSALDTFSEGMEETKSESFRDRRAGRGHFREMLSQHPDSLRNNPPPFNWKGTNV